MSKGYHPVDTIPQKLVGARTSKSTRKTPGGEGIFSLKAQDTTTIISRTQNSTTLSTMAKFALASRTVGLSLLLLVVSGAAFSVRPPAASSTTALHMKFLKDMGFEKPGWLPDFGGSKEEKKEEPASAAPAADTTVSEEPAKEEPAKAE
jgi:hypothetical protein